LGKAKAFEFVDEFLTKDAKSERDLDKALEEALVSNKNLIGNFTFTHSANGLPERLFAQNRRNVQQNILLQLCHCVRETIHQNALMGALADESNLIKMIWKYASSWLEIQSLWRAKVEL
jgi:hypothetical protein